MYQVIERDPKTKKTLIHNFDRKREATKKQKELKAAGRSDGEIWDTNDNPISNAIGKFF